MMPGVTAILSDALTLAAIPSPTFSEQRRAEWVMDRLSEAGGSRVIDETGNVIWTWGSGRPALLMTAHLDTVFAADAELSFRREGDHLIGPGIGDNALAIAAVIDVVEEHLAASPTSAGAVAFTVGEEGLGNLRGAVAACERLRPMACIAVEGHGLSRFFADAVGSVRIQLVVDGPGGHSWSDRGTPSAIHALVEAGARLAATSGVNIGVIAGGRSVNTIADRAELVVEMRSIDPAALDRFAAEVGGVRVAPALTASSTVVGQRPAGRLSRDSELFRVVRQVRAELGLETVASAASTDANAALALGIPALSLGVAEGEQMHTPAERIQISSVALGRRQLAQVLHRLA
jgi:tripeptide aminopeptidase